MKKLLCLLVLSSLVRFTLAAPLSILRPPPDFSVKGIVQGVSQLEKNWGLLINGKTIVVGNEAGLAIRITRAGARASMKDAVVGDSVVVEYTHVPKNVMVGRRPTPTFVPVVRAVSFSPASPAGNAVDKGEAEKKKATASAATVKFYQEKAEKGDALGQYRMGLYYLKGDGVPKDIDKARDYLSKAAAQGNQDAAAEIAKFSAPDASVQTNSPPKKGEDR
jgi:hypothetical protein